MKLKRVLWGIVLILAGVLWILDLFQILTFDLFFNGWWTFLIIIPSAIGLFTDREKIGSAFALLFGVGLFCAVNGYFVTTEMLWKLFIPAVIIAIGLKLIFGDALSGKRSKARKHAEEKIREKGTEKKEYCATFSGMNLNFDGQLIEYLELTAVFGGIDCDFAGAAFADDAVIRVCAIFGGIDLRIPSDVNVTISSTNIFGGTSDERKRPDEMVNNSQTTAYVGGSCIFGGVSIK